MKINAVLRCKEPEIKPRAYEVSDVIGDAYDLDAMFVVSVGFAENDMIVQLYKNGELMGDYVSESVFAEIYQYRKYSNNRQC